MMHRRVVDGGLRLHKTIYCCLFWNNNSRCELWRENSQNYFIRLFLIQSWRWGILSTALLSPPFSLSLPSLRKILQRLRGGRIAVGAGSWAPENPGESRRIPENLWESWEKVEERRKAVIVADGRSLLRITVAVDDGPVRCGRWNRIGGPVALPVASVHWNPVRPLYHDAYFGLILPDSSRFDPELPRNCPGIALNCPRLPQTGQDSLMKDSPGFFPQFFGLKLRLGAVRDGVSESDKNDNWLLIH